MRLPEPMRHRFDNLEQDLRAKAQGKTIYYVANLGNWGDGLIRAGTLEFFRERDISVIEHPYQRYRRRWWSRPPRWLKAVDKNNSVLVFGGGGAWCEFWDISNSVRQMARHFSSTIVLPSTLQVDCSNIPAVFFSRDRNESLQANPDAIFCDDMAFCLFPRPPRQDATSRDGYFFRTDKESAVSGALPEQNRDCSLEGNHFSELDQFFAILEPFEIIHTDRLHVAIAGSILGRKVELYPGGYYKNHSVFSSSLEGNFPNVRFHAEPFGS